MNQDQFIEAALRNSSNLTILGRLDQLQVDDAWLVSGALFQSVWNVLSGRTPTYGIKDYDIFYYDPDPSWEAEDRVIKRANEVFRDLGIEVEVRNQGRVHLWYGEKFHVPYPRLGRSTDGIDRFLMDAAMVGMRQMGDRYEVYAPKGFSDIASMTIRPNRSPNFLAARYMEKSERWRELWPELKVLPAGDS